MQDLPELFVEALPKRTAYYAFLEVCCDKDSALKRACSTSGLDIWEFHQTWSCLGFNEEFGICRTTENGRLVSSCTCFHAMFKWVPLRNFHGGVGETETWKIVMSSASFYLNLVTKRHSNCRSTTRFGTVNLLTRLLKEVA